MKYIVYKLIGLPACDNPCKYVIYMDVSGKFYTHNYTFGVINGCLHILSSFLCKKITFLKSSSLMPAWKILYCSISTD